MQRGQLFLLKPDQFGKQRPIVVVSHDRLNAGHSVIAVPFYSQQLQKRAQQPWCALFKAGDGGLKVDCVAKTDELSMIDKLSIDVATGPIGQFNVNQMAHLMHAMKWSLEIP